MRAETPRPLPIPPNLELRNVPPLSQDLRDRLLPYTNSRSAQLVEWDREGRGLVIATRFGDSSQLHEVRQPMGARTQLTFFTEPVTTATSRPGKARELAFLRDEGGNENFQVYLLDRDSGEIRRLSDGLHRYQNPRWSPDGRLLAYNSYARNGRDADLCVFDFDAGRERPVAEVSGSWSVLDWSRDGRRVLLQQFLSVEQSHLWAIEVASGSRTQLDDPTAPPAAYDHGRFSPDGTSVYALTDREGEFRQLARLDLESHLWTSFSAEIPWDAEAFDLSSDGALLAASFNEDGISRVRLFDAATGEARKGPELPPGEVTELLFRPGSHELGLTLTWAQAPGDVYSFDPRLGQLERWTASETGGIPASRFVVPELVRFPTFDRLPSANPKEAGPERTIPAFVYRPDRQRFPGPRPVLIDIHGGPESQSRPGFLGQDNFLVNELGLALVLPNVRGSSGYGRTYIALDNGRGREDSVRDIGALLDWIKTQPDLDASRVMVSGGSYGGYMVLASLVMFGDRLAGGYDVVGISNFVTFLTNTQDYRRDLRRAEYGDERIPEMRQFLETISPLNQVQRIRGPLLIAQGANDPRVPLSESTQMVEALEKRGVPVWYVVGKDEGHGFRKKPNADYLQAVFLEFLGRYLLQAAPASG